MLHVDDNAGAGLGVDGWRNEPCVGLGVGTVDVARCLGIGAAEAPVDTLDCNSLEVIEAVKVLKGEQKGDLYNVCIELAANMLHLTSGKSLDICRELAKGAVENGSAFRKLKEIVNAQGGDVKVLDNTDLFAKAKYSLNVTADESGYISRLDSEKIGISSVVLGAGRETKGEKIDHSAGIVLNKKTGDFVNKGDIVATLYTNNQDKFCSAEKIFLSAVEFSEEKPKEQPLIYF